MPFPDVVHSHDFRSLRLNCVPGKEGRLATVPKLKRHISDSLSACQAVYASLLYHVAMTNGGAGSTFADCRR